MKRWTIYVCDKGHVDHSTLNGVCWQCFPGGRRTWEPGRPKETKPNQERIEVAPASEVERQRERADEMATRARRHLQRADELGRDKTYADREVERLREANAAMEAVAREAIEMLLAALRPDEEGTG